MARAAILKKCDPIEYFDGFLATENFPDGRPIDKFSEIKIYPGTSWKKQRTVVSEHGNVVVSITGRLILQRDNDSPSMVFKFESPDKKAENSFSFVKTTLNSFVKSNVFFDRDQLKTDEEAFRYQLRFTITIFTAEGFIMNAILTGLNALLLQIKIPKNSFSFVKTTLNSFVKSNVFFDRDQLKTDEEAFRYQLRFTITIFTAEGFIMNAILTGLNALLLQIKIPKVEYQWLQTLERDEQTIDPKRIKINENDCSKLKLKEIPVYSVFGLYTLRGQDKPLLLSDPTFDMVPFCASIIEMICISKGQILLSNVTGNHTISPELFEEAAMKALEHHDEVVKSLNSYVKVLNLD
uniref:Uncharacterized protein n=1 Tax=Panagrolaimus sp. JU765 TaxID=591449 RepID=A0AC34Q1I9_9BILA